MRDRRSPPIVPDGREQRPSSSRIWVAPLTDLILMAVALADAMLSLERASVQEIVVSIVAVAGIAVRRRWPFVTVLLALPGLYLAEAGIAAVIGVYSVAVSPTRRWSIPVASTLVFLGYLTATTSASSHAEWFVIALYSAVFAVGPAALGLLVVTRRELRTQLAELRARRLADQRRAALDALEQERAKLAREMHDVVSHQVGLIAVQAGALQVSTADDSVRDTARTIRDLSVTTLQELRSMVGVLRRSGGDLPGLDPSLQSLHGLIEQSAVSAEVDLDLPQGVPLPVRRAVYRALQEALTNARKHAPESPVTIVLRSDAGELELCVRNRLRVSEGDDTSDLPGGQVGLIGLSERAELLSGTFTAGSPDGVHFELRLRVPLV